MNNWKTWLKGLAAAAIGGGTSAVSMTVTNPSAVMTTAGLKQVGTVAAVSAGLSAILYLKRSPLPGMGTEVK